MLGGIPAQYLMIERGEVPRKVRRIIEKGWRRSALVAWDSRPRDVSCEVREGEADASISGTGEEDGSGHDGSTRRHDRRFLKGRRVDEITVLRADVALKAWGRISHPGWSPPDAATGREDSVQYATVIVELPHLLEAKAVSLAPPEANLDPHRDLVDEEADIVPDARIVAILQRPPGMGLRDYINHLASLSVLASPEEAELFLEQYEYARFSDKALTEQQFENLMAAFAILLSTMVLDLDIITPFIDSSDLEMEFDSVSTSVASQELEAQSIHDAESVLYHERDDGSVRHHPPTSSSISQTGDSARSIIINTPVHI